MRSPKEPRRPAKRHRPPAFHRNKRVAALCGAIHDRTLIELRLRDELLWRTYEPNALYRSARNRLVLAGIQLSNPNDPLAQAGPQDLELRTIEEIRPIAWHFNISPLFHPADPKYRRGFVCVVDGREKRARGS